ncbi:unnamed protein product, partial [Timema podura]|nr:unnamed protein product [Timema podura]
SVPAFAWREGGKTFRKTTHDTPTQDLILDLPVISSLVYCESSAIDNESTKLAVPIAQSSQCSDSPFCTTSTLLRFVDAVSSQVTSPDLKYLITGGNDGDIRLWMGLEDDDPTSHCVGERALAVKQMGKRLFVGTDNNTVQAYTFPELEPDGIITRFGAPVTHISVSKDGNTIAAASEDMEVHIYDVALQKSTVIASHTGPVFGVELDPKLEFVASCSGDGTVRVWNLSQNKLGHSWKCVPICNSFLLTKVLGRPSWLPSTGQLLALPNGKQVCLYKRGTWEQTTTLTNAQVEKEIFRRGDLFKLFFNFFLPLFIPLDSCCPLTISALSRVPQTMMSLFAVMYSYVQSGTNLCHISSSHSQVKVRGA